MLIQWPSCVFNLWSCCSSRPKQRRSCRMLLPPMVGCAAAEASPPPTIPTAGQAIPLLTHTPCYSAATTASHRSEPVNPRTPLRVGIHCRVFPGSVSSPFQASPSPTALVLSAWHGQRGQGTASIGRGLYVERLTAGSTAAARKCLLITRKIIIPPPDSGDPPDGPPYFVKKMFPPDY